MKMTNENEINNEVNTDRGEHRLPVDSATITPKMTDAEFLRAMGDAPFVCSKCDQPLDGNQCNHCGWLPEIIAEMVPDERYQYDHVFDNPANDRTTVGFPDDSPSWYGRESRVHVAIFDPKDEDLRPLAERWVLYHVRRGYDWVAIGVGTTRQFDQFWSPAADSCIDCEAGFVTKNGRVIEAGFTPAHIREHGLPTYDGRHVFTMDDNWVDTYSPHYSDEAEEALHEWEAYLRDRRIERNFKDEDGNGEEIAWDETDFSNGDDDDYTMSAWHRSGDPCQHYPDMGQSPEFQPTYAMYW